MNRTQVWLPPHAQHESNSPIALQRKAMRELDYFVEWGGPVWTRLTRGCLQGLAEQRWFEGKRVVELGCRRARISGLFAMLGAEVVAVDHSDVYLPAAREELARLGVQDRCELVVDDAMSFFQQNVGEFDLVFSKSVLVVVPQAEELLAAAIKSLRPEGRFIAIENGRGNLAIRMLRWCRRSKRELTTWRYFDHQRVKAIGRRFRQFQYQASRFPPVYAMHGVI